MKHLRFLLIGVVSLCYAPALSSAEPLPSGTVFLSQELRARQADPSTNPGMLWVDAGRDLWQSPAPNINRSCATCHGDARMSMRGVAARYPLVDANSNQLLNLEARINQCRTLRMGGEALAYESDDLLALTAFVARQSNGLPISVKVDGNARHSFDRGKAFFQRRQGQLNLSCAQCHVDHAGKPLRGETISHAVPSGYPIYRLAWQTLGSLHRRLRSCSNGVRAVQFEFGSQPYLELELYLRARSNGVLVEVPAVRR